MSGHKLQCQDVWTKSLLFRKTSCKTASKGYYMEKKGNNSSNICQSWRERKSTAQTLDLAKQYGPSENSQPTLTLPVAHSKKFFLVSNESLVDTLGKLYRITAIVLVVTDLRKTLANQNRHHHYLYDQHHDHLHYPKDGNDHQQPTSCFWVLNGCD